MKKHMKRMIAGASTAALMAVVASHMSQPVSAAVHTADLAVTANVAANCRVAAGTMAFGSYDSIGTHETTDLDAPGSFQVRCTRGGVATLSLDDGGHATAGTRRMEGTVGEFLNYNLYTTSGYTTVWNTTNTVTFGPTANSAFSTVDVYGRIPAGQDVRANNYSDTVTITANF